MARRRPSRRDTAFRAHKGAAPVKPAFAAHTALVQQTVYAAHAVRAITYAKATAAKSAPAKTTVIKFKSAIKAAPAAWTEKTRKPVKYKPVKPKNLPGGS